MGPIYLSGSQKTKRATLQETPTRALNQTLHFRQCKISIRGNYFVKQRSDPCLLSAAKQTSCCWQWGPTLKWRQLRQGLERAWKRAHKWHNDENFTDAKYNDGSDISWNQDKTPTPAGISSYPSARKQPRATAVSCGCGTAALVGLELGKLSF